MTDFTNDEINLMCIYRTGSRQELVNDLITMKAFLTSEEIPLITLTNTVLEKLLRITDEEFEALELYPDFPEEAADGSRFNGQEGR